MPLLGKSGYSSIASLTMFKSPISVFIGIFQVFRNITGYERPASEMVHFVYYDPTRKPDWTVVIFDANVSNAKIVCPDPILIQSYTTIVL